MLVKTYLSFLFVLRLQSGALKVFIVDFLTFLRLYASKDVFIFFSSTSTREHKVQITVCESSSLAENALMDIRTLCYCYLVLVI
jgi:archaellum biogenesis ATPase FlaH